MILRARPARLGPYRILRELGSGGMAAVHLAEVAEDGAGLAPGDLVALKVFHGHLFRDRDFFKRFLEEADIGRRIRHRNVVRILDADAQLSRGRLLPYLAMEYVPGKSLARLLEEGGPLPEG